MPGQADYAFRESCSKPQVRRKWKNIELAQVTRMNFKFGIVAVLALTTLLSSNTAVAQKPQLPPKVLGLTPENESAHPYRLFETTNIWTFILLNTANGRAWQVNYSLNDSPAVRLIINGDSLLPEGVAPRNGRFTLYSTNNMYNFMLLDREDSRIWQLQWSHDAEKRGLVRSIPLDR